MSPARPVRVLVLDHTAELGGAELALVRLVAALGPDVDVRCLLFADGPLVGALRAHGVAVEVLALASGVGGAGRHDAGRATWANLRRLAQVVPFAWALTRRLRELRPDVVHTTSLKADLLGLLPALLARRPLVWYVHDRIAADYLPTPWVRLVRWASRLPAEVLANSRATAATLPVAAVVAYPGFAPGQAIEADDVVPARPSAAVIGIVGRISPTKGQLEFVRAAALVLEAHPGATFRVVGAPTFGTGDYEDAVRREAERLGVAPRLTWVGEVADTADELDRMTVCVHASGVPEPFGQVVVEAMIRGVPVVATAAGGVPEILADPARPDDDLGVLVPPGDVPALAAAIVGLLDDPAAAAARADRARLAALARFPVSRTARTVSSAWRRAARSARSPRP